VVREEGIADESRKQKKFSEYVLFMYIVLSVDHMSRLTLKKAARLKVESRKYIANNEWYGTCNANQSFRLHKCPQIKTQKSLDLASILFLSPESSANKRLFPLVIFSTSSPRTTSYSSLFLTHYEKIFPAFDFEARCFLQG
jgi:hypothetical protein